VVGDDIFGNFMLEALTSCGVDTSYVIIDPAQKTGLTVILNRVDDRAMLTHLGAINALCSDQIPDSLLSQSRHLHLASYFLQTNLQPDVPALFRRARRMGLTTSMDTNWDPEERWVGVHDILPMTNVFLPNDNEALALARESEVETAARILADDSEVVAVKLGSEGAFAVTCETQVSAPAIPVQVVDTVGAGDAFDAGFIFGYLQGWSLDRTLRLGIACGSLSTQKQGGLEGQPTYDEALAYL
jgi:sugar/nucleoside kinase (ribokinase family)